MELRTINDVVTVLDGIVQHCIQTKDRAGYFAALYKRTTMAVGEGITKGIFEDGKRMELLDIIFAQYYLDAWKAYQHQGEFTASWQYTFSACSNHSLTVIQHLLLGMNTHINLDLAIAAATVAPGTSIHALARDFILINDIIATLIDDVQQCLEEVWFPMRWVKRIAAKREEAVFNFSIGIARKTAWAIATALAYMNPQERAAHLKTMDAMVNKIGYRIINPGLWPQLILRIIRMTEYEDIARTIRLINTTVVTDDSG